MRRTMQGRIGYFAAMFGLACLVLMVAAPGAQAVGSRPSSVSLSVYTSGVAGEIDGSVSVGWTDGTFAPRTGTIEVHDAQRSYGTFNADNGWRPGEALPLSTNNLHLGKLAAGTYTLTAVY